MIGTLGEGKGLKRGWLQRLALSLLLLGMPLAEAATIQKVRMWLAPDHARLVFDLNGPISHTLFPLDNPDRLVIDIPDTTLKANLSEVGLAKSPIRRMRSARNDGSLRIVLDMKEKVRPRSFELQPNDKYGYRLVVDLYRDAKKAQQNVVKTAASAQRRDIVVSIDAGHGGEDPGAIGPGRVFEKNVVFAIAKEVDRLLDAEPGFKGEMTRTGDYYVSLRGRTGLARKRNADMFVSIHADGFKSPRASGASVWVLSNRGASSEMGRWLARRENQTDLIGGVGSVSLGDKDKTLKSVLLDMSITASRSDSREIASAIHRNIASFAKMHKKHVEQAGFVVLKSPDIPSILVETGFITNPGEARKLKTRAYQRKMAQAIFRGIKAHFYNKPPANSWVAWNKRGKKDLPIVQTPIEPPRTAPEDTLRYKVVSGDSLSTIASRHGVSVARLKSLNGLKSNKIRKGQWLTIKPGSNRSAQTVASAPAQPSKSARTPKSTNKKSLTGRYRVVRGDTLSTIASRHGMSLSQLKRLNGLRSNKVRVDQVLKINGGTPATSAVITYRVVRGDSLSVIARRHGMTLSALKRLNGLRSNTVRVGQRLKVNSGNTLSPVKYRVVRGDSLSTIASRYGVTQSSLRSANRLRGSTIKIGQVLLIPAS